MENGHCSYTTSSVAEKGLRDTLCKFSLDGLRSKGPFQKTFRPHISLPPGYFAPHYFRNAIFVHFQGRDSKARRFCDTYHRIAYFWTTIASPLALTTGLHFHSYLKSKCRTMWAPFELNPGPVPPCVYCGCRPARRFITMEEEPIWS